jgi:glutamate formiminotransferase/formiminotetrahydrofolate cyclodeaminase
MAAYRLPKDSDEQQNARRAAIQIALKRATQVPLETATACAATLRLVGRIVAAINPNALSDAATAAVLAEAGLRGAQFNVAVNLAGIQDAEFVQEARQALARALEGADEERERVVAYVLGA